ncbi:MAG TPA: putative Ig domain-containing protein [Rhodanobacter sp.]
MMQPDAPPGGTITVPAAWVAASTVGLSYSASTGKITGTLKPLIYDGGTKYTYSLRIVASDGSMTTATPNMGITVNQEHAPTATTIPAQSVGRNTAWSFNAKSYFSDADGDALTFTASGLPSGFSINASTGVISGTASSTTSSATVTVSASDGRGGSVSKAFTLSVVDSAPVYGGATLPSFTGDEGKAVSWTVPTGLFTDPNGDALTYTLQVLEPAYTTTDPGALATTQAASLSLDGTDGMMQPDAPPGGTITVPAAWVAASTVGLSYNASTGKITGTVKPLVYDGGTKYTYSLRIVASDGTMTGDSSNIGVTVNQDHAPVATTIPAQSVGRNTAWSFNAKSYFSDADGDALTFSASGLPSGLSINSSTGVISGTAANATSSSTVTVTANDGRGHTGSKAFTLSVVNTAPTYAGASTLSGYAGDQGKAVSWTVPGGLFSDANGDALTYTLQVLSGSTWTAASAVGLSYSASTNKITGTLAPLGSSYSYSLRIVASDGSASTATPNIGVTVNQNHVPTASTIPAQSIGRNVSWSFNAKSYFSDADGDALTFSASGLPSGLSINASTGVISGKATGIGSSTVTVTASDGRGGSVGKAFTLGVVNNAPVYSGATLPGFSGNEGHAVAWTVPSGLFTDPNGDALTYTLQVYHPQYISYPPDAQGPLIESTQATDGTQDSAEPASVMVPMAPPGGGVIIPAGWEPASDVGLSYNASTGLITGTLEPYAYGDPGDDAAVLYSLSLRIVASDGSATAVTPNISATVNPNHAPTASTIPAQNIVGNTAWSFNAKAYFSDADGDALTFSATGLPGGLSLNGSTGVISGTATANGSYSVVVTANDGHGHATSTTFALSVTDGSPVYNGTLPARSGTVGQAVSWSLPAGAFTAANGHSLSYALQVYVPAHWEDAPLLDLAIDASSATDAATEADAPDATVSSDGMMQPDAPPGQIHVPAAWESASFVGLSINASTGLITGTLKPLYYGESTVSYTPQLRIIASDGSASATGQFDVTEAHTTGTSSVASLSSVSAQEAADTDAGDADAALRLDAAAPADLATESVSMQPMMLPPPGPGDDLPPGYSPPTHVTYRETDSWYTYDAENHILVNNGQMDASTHVIGVKNNDDTSYSSTYDAVGEEVTHTTKTGGTGYIQQTAYDLRGNKTVVYQAVVQGSATPAGIAMTYTYNAQNQLSHVLTYYAAGSTESITLTQGATPPLPTLQVAVHLDGWVQSDEAYTYDATTGVLVSQTKQTRDENGRTYSMSLGAYETTGALPVHADGFTNATTDYAVVYAAADAAGRQTAYTYQSPDYGNATITYGTHYIGLDSWQEATVTGGSSNPSYKTTTTTLSYDGYGKLVKQVESTYGVSGLDDRATYYGYDGDGQVLTRQAGTVKSNGTFVLGTDADGNLDKRMYVYAAGQEMAELHAGDYSRWNTDGGAGSIASLAGSGSYSAGGSRVVVQAGDTLTSLAQRVYGDASRWYVLADANGLSSASDVLVEGASLKAPSITVNGNDAGTFKPYDASEAIGNTAPSLPYVQPPSSKDHCQALSAIIQIAVTVIVTIISRNPVVGAAAGDAAGQFSSAALNGRFDWRGFVEGATNPLHVAENGLVAASGLSDWVIPAVMLFGNDKQKAVFNPIGYGMDYDYTRTAIAAGAAYAGSAAGGMVSSAAGYGAAATAGAAATGAAAAYGTSYGLSKLAGYDVAFSWKEVAASAATAAAGSGISQGLGVEYSQVPGTGAVVRAQPFSWNAVTADVLTSAADYGLRKGLGLDAHWDTERVLADAFGNALGNAIVGAQPSPLAVDREQIPQEPVALQVEDSLGPMTMGPLGAQPNLDDLDAQLQKANQDIANANARLAELDKEEAALGGNPTGSYRYDENGLEIDIIGGRPESEGGNVLDGIDSKIQGFNQIVRDELVDEGAQALHDGNQAAYVLGGLKYAFYQTFMPDSVEGAVVGLVGGKVIGSGLNLAAKGAVAAAPWLGRDVGSLASDGYQWAKNPLGEEFDAGYSPQNLFDAYQDVPRSSAIDFSQAPRLDVGGVPNNVGLRSSAVISSDRAESFLIKNGIEPDFAKSYIAEMDGDITARLVRPNEDFLRYFDAPKDQGSFLTKTVFDSPSSAVDGLNLGPYGNKADLVQTVTSKGRTIILEAGVKNGGADVRQFLIHDRSVFEFSPGRNY